jgi:hypothetical protein
VSQAVRPQIYLGERANLAAAFINELFDGRRIERDGMVWRVPRNATELDQPGATPCLFWNDETLIRQAEFHAGGAAQFQSWIEGERKRALEVKP